MAINGKGEKGHERGKAQQRWPCWMTAAR